VLSTDLERRIVPQLIQLVLSPDGHKIRLGNRNTAQLANLSSVLLPADSPEAIHAVLLEFSRTLVSRIYDPIILRALQCKYKPFSARPIKEPKVFYSVRLGHVPGVYTS